MSRLSSPFGYLFSASMSSFTILISFPIRFVEDYYGMLTLSNKCLLFGLIGLLWLVSNASKGDYVRGELSMLAET